MAENAVRRSLQMHVDESRLPHFVRINGGVKAMMSRWVTMDDVLDVANAVVVCFEEPAEPLFPRQGMYFAFFADFISAMETNEQVIGTMARDDVFQFKLRQSRYTLCRRYNGGKIMWLLTRMPLGAMPEEQIGSSARTADHACGNEYGETHAHPSAH